MRFARGTCGIHARADRRESPLRGLRLLCLTAVDSRRFPTVQNAADRLETYEIRDSQHASVPGTDSDELEKLTRGMTLPPEVSLQPEVWQGVLRRLQADLPEFAFHAWILPLAVKQAGDGLEISCRSTFHRDRIRDHFLERIATGLESERGTPVPISLAIDQHPGSTCAEDSAPGVPAAEPRPAPAPAPERARHTGPSQAPPASPRTAMQPDFESTFENFVVGPCNALAREASFAIALHRQRELRGLYLCSAPGMGKTHLARAAVMEARRTSRDQVQYLSAEAFTEQFTSSLRNGGLPGFKRRLRRECELLVVEDIQFLQGKKQTQLEFFHTVGHVLDAGGRVLLTGDRPPQELVQLDSRIRSQLSRGFVAELEAPDAIVRRGILRTKAAGGGVRLPEDCLDLLVESVRGSVRDLEGVLIQLVTTASLLKRPIDNALTREVLSRRGAELEAPSGPSLDADRVIRAVASSFKTTPEALASRSRRRDVLVPRQLAMYLCRRYTDASLTDIGRAFGRDHPAVRNAVAKVEREILERAPMRYQVEALASRLDELVDRERG